MHEHPDRPWTPVTLAESVGASRTALAERFSTVNGHPTDALPSTLAAPSRSPASYRQPGHRVINGPCRRLQLGSRLQPGVQKVDGSCSRSMAPEIRSSRAVIATAPAGVSKGTCGPRRPGRVIW
jgi:hypothetical protein